MGWERKENMAGKEELNKIMQFCIPKGKTGSLQLGNMLLQWGTVSASVSAESYAEQYVSFKTSYAELPFVIVTKEIITNFTELWDVHLISHTTKEVRLNFRNLYTNPTTITANWLAGGKILSGGGALLNRLFAPLMRLDRGCVA